MADVLELSWLTLILAAVVLILVLRVFHTGTAAGLPPLIGFRFPIIGNMSQFKEKDKRIPLRKYRAKIGNIYSLYLGQQLVIIVAGRDLIMEMLRRNDFIGKPKYPLDRLLKVTHLGIGQTSGHYWKEQRGFALTVLKNLEHVKGIMEPRIHAEVDIFLSAFRNQQKEPFGPYEFTVQTQGNITNSVIFGRQFNRQDERFKKVLQLTRQFLDKGSSRIPQMIPCVASLPGDLFGYKKIINIHQELIGTYRALLEEHNEIIDESSIDCFASAYIKQMNIEKKTNPETSFSLESLGIFIEDMQFAQDVMISTIDWSLALLATNPEMQHRMYTEIVDNVGSRNTPTAQDRLKLPYVEAFYMEVMRFCNTTIHSLPRAANTETKLGGYTIPTDAMILPDFDSIFTDETIWGDPGVFRPERFLDNDGLFHDNKDFVPFSIGPRNCIGIPFAKMQLFIWLSSIVQSFSIEIPDGADLSMKTIDGLFVFTHAPKLFKIVAIAREEKIENNIEAHT